jgi:methyl-accepting chemotaxis protein
MKSSRLALKVTLNSFLVILVAFTLMQGVNYLRDAILLATGSPEEFLGEFLFYMGTRVVPVTLFFAVILFLYALRIQRMIQRLAAGEQLSEDLLQWTRIRIIRFRTIVLALNLLGFTAGFVVDLAISGRLGDALQFDSLLTLAFNLVSGGVYASAQNAFNAIIFAEPRQLLRIYAIAGDRLERPWHLKRLGLTLLLVTYGLLFFFTAQQDVFRQELTYSTVLERALAGRSSLDQARSAYRDSIAKALSEASSRIQRGAHQILFPLDGISPAQRLHADRVIFLLLTILVLAIAAVVELASAAGHRRQIQAMSGRMAELAKGGGDLSARLSISQFDELGLLADRINRFIEQLHGLIDQAARVTKEVRGSSAHINLSLESASAAVEQMLASSRQVERNVNSQLEVVRQTRENFKAMSGAIDAITASAGEQVTYVEETSAAIEEMAASISSVSQMAAGADATARELAELAQKGSQAVGESVGAIQEIEQASLTVSDLVAVISVIASQTDLLAMNAAIEAAHAGVAGRGFAVVADEVRKLSVDSAARTREIASQVKSMAGRVRNGVDLSLRAGEALGRIAEGSSRSNSMIANISAAMREQAVGARQILSAVASVVSSTQSIKGQTKDQHRQSDNLQASVESLMGAASDIQRAAGEQVLGSQAIVDAVNRVREQAGANIAVVRSLEEILGRFILSSSDRNA